MRLLILLSTVYLLLVAQTSLSQTSLSQTSGVSRISASLKNFLAAEIPDRRFMTEKDGSAFVSLFIELQPAAVNDANNPQTSINASGSQATPGRDVLSNYGVRQRTRTGNIMTADVPLDQVRALATDPAVRRLELPLLLSKSDTTMKKHVTADRVLKGDAPLKQAFTGRNVLIGVIDDGIDVSHPDFLDSNGNSLISELWNMDRAGTPPVGYTYGHVWPNDSLTSFAKQFNTTRNNPYEQHRLLGYGFHGTPVASLAGGRNGVAPGASIVVVALTATVDTLLKSDRVIDAIAYIYSRAKAQHKKCVVNISLNTLDGGPHDGNSMLERAIDEFCSEKPDILITVSAGNAGNTWKHWGGMPINKDSSFGFFRCAYQASLYFTIPKQYTATLSFSLAESRLGNLNNPNITRDSIFYQTPFVAVTDIVNSSTPLTFASTFKGQRSSTITLTGSHYNDEYDELILTTWEHTSSANGNVFDDHLYRFIFKGTGIVHGWYPFLNLHPIYFFDRNPYPNDSTYRSTDNNYTTGIPANAFTVLSAGAYNIRQCYVSHIHNEVVSGYSSCQMAHFTSRGPTLDGRIKPDIVAPGDNVIAARSRMEDYYGHQFIIDTNRLAFGGTSAASPIAAGVAALIWESDSTLTRRNVIDRIRTSAYNDSYTAVNGPAPNNISGYGKIDAFKAITGVATELSILCGNTPYCEIAHTGTGTNPGGGPVLPGGSAEPFYMKLFPNPARNAVSVTYRSPVPLKMSIYNSIGQLVLQRSLQANNNGMIFTLPIYSLASGIYFVTLTGINISVTQRFVVAGG